MKCLVRPATQARFAAVALLLLILSAAPGFAAITRQIITSSLSTPIHVAAPPGDKERLFVVQRGGTIRIIDLNTNTVLPTAFLNVNDAPSTNVSTTGEGGLLSIAFHADYAENGFFFVYYTTSLPGTGFTTRVSRFTVTSDPNVADPNSEAIFFELDQPQTNHNGGMIAFRPDDPEHYLFVGLGDGGGGCDPLLAAQNLGDKLGKMLRIDVDPGPSSDVQNPFAPSTNPYVGMSGDDLIWSRGLRNPFRWSFDRDKGDMYIGDVGQDTVEEIDFEAANATGGLNYGWNAREGDIAAPCGDTSPELPGMIEPITVYDHNGQSASVSGGYIYRGHTYGTMFGRYFFADFERGTVWSCIPSSTSVSNLQTHTTALNPGGGNIVGFGEDGNGELYIIDFSGTVSRIIDPTSPSADVDQDGIADAYETNTGTYVSPFNTGTNPNSADSDSDGFIDSLEIADGTNPNSAGSNTPRTDAYVEIGAAIPRMGTQENPASTLAGALGILQAGGTVHFVNSGNLNETGTFNKGSTVRAEDGTVMVGTP